MIKVCIIGHFGKGERLLNGQTVKTKNVTYELEKQLGSENVLKIDTYGGAKVIPKLIIQIFSSFKKCQNIIIFPAQNGIRLVAPLCILFNIIFHRKIHYVVIGGWLSDFLQNRVVLTNVLRKFDGIYVETNTMKNALNRKGFQNVVMLPNFKKLKVLKKEELLSIESEPKLFCTFSRVMKEKGIEDAIRAVEFINTKVGRTVALLDIYGQIESGQEEWFQKLLQNVPSYVNYKGCVSASNSVETLKHYYALFFPTHFFTEGIPGTIIDAYASGVPVISARWESFSDVVDEQITGFGYQFGNTGELYDLAYEVFNMDSKEFMKIKTNCLDKALKYIPENVISILINRF